MLVNVKGKNYEIDKEANGQDLAKLVLEADEKKGCCH